MDSNKELPFCERPVMKNVPLCCILRETGFLRQTGGPSRGLQLAAEERLILKNHEEYDCHLPDGTRSTFLMVFSPDGKMVASTHGNHNVYVTDFTNGRNVKTLTGHPRTPWCIAFHPSSNQILASGCLGGQVRVWDLHGGSEIWMAESQTVIASLAFHPTDRVLVIASYNELHFWDWSQAKPFAKCCTSNEREKVRYVAFDEGGGKLVTGIANAGGRQSSQWDRVSAPQPPPQLSQLEHERRITICYRYMVEQYEQLLDRYYRLHGGNGSNGGEGSSTGNGEGAGAGTGEEGGAGAGAGVGESNGSRTGDPLAGRGGSTNPPFSNRGTQPPPRLPYIGTAWRRHALALTGGISTIDRGTDPMEPAEESPNRCAVCRRTNISSDENEPGPSSSSSSNPSHRHVTGTDEVSASHSSSQFMPERTSETDQSLLSLRTNLLFERLARLRAQVETGRNILARTRTAAAAMTARMSPSAPEEASLLIERTPPTPREESPASRLGHLLMLPEPLIPQDRPSIIRRIGSYLSRRRNPARAYGSTSSSESASLSDGLPAWERPLTPPPPRAPASLTSLRLTNLTGPASNRRVLFDHVSSDGPPHTPNPFAPQNTSYHSPRRYFRDSGSNTEPPSESNSSDSNSSSVQRNTESSLAIGRLRAQFRRLQSVYNIRGDREPHLLREAADDAERRLVSRLTNLLERPFPSTSSIPESRFPSPQGASSDLSSVRFGLDLLGRHIDNLSNQCSRVRLDTGEMTRMWEELESQVATLERAIRQEPPVVRVSPENSADGEGTGVSSSPLPTDEESEDSVVSNSARRLLGPRRFRFLHRPAYKRPRFDRHLPSPLRFTRRNLLGSPDDESDENDDDDEEGERRGNADGGRGSDDSEGHGLKRKATPDTSTPLAGTSSTPSNETPRGFSRISVRVRANSRRGCRNCNTPRNYMLRVSHTGCRPLSLSEYRENSRGRENQDDRNSPRGGRGTPSSRENIRNRARHDLLLMVDSLTQFFENDTLARTPNNNENLRERTSNLINLLEFALNLTDLLLTQLGMSNSEEPAGGRERRGGGGWHQPTPREENPRPSHRRSSYANPNPRRIVLVSEEPHPSPGRPSLPLLRVNDGPVPPETSPPSPRLPEPPPPYPASLGVRRTRALPSRLLRMPFLFDDSSEDSSHDRHDIFYRAQASGVFTHDTPLAPHHRIQAWDFSKYKLPEIHLADKNVVVAESKVHNDASVDISKDSKLLVTLLPSGRLCITTTIGVYSLQWETLGQCLYVTSFDMNAVSVSLSPTNRHLLVGLAARRVHFIHTDKQTFAQILRLEGGRPSRNGGSMKGRLVLVKELETSREMSTDYMSLNCIRWSPTPGEAIVYGTNTGKLKVLR